MRGGKLQKYKYNDYGKEDGRGHETRAVRELQQEDIERIAQTFDSYRQGTLEDEKGFCAVKTLDDIKAQDYILTPGRYVGIAEQQDDAGR